jgi:hypothetical protein
VADIAAFVATLIERRDKVFGRRFDLAGDELSGEEQAKILSHANKLDDAFWWYREGVRPLAQRTDRPWRNDVLHEGGRRADGVRNAETGNVLLDEILAIEMRDARFLVGIGNGRIDQMPDAGILRSFRSNDPLTGLFLGPNFVAVAHKKHCVDAACRLP